MPRCGGFSHEENGDDPMTQESHTTPTPLDGFIDGQFDPDELNEHIGGQHASDIFQSRRRLPTAQPFTYSSTFDVLDARWSINPAHEVTRSLRLQYHARRARTSSETSVISEDWDMEEGVAAAEVEQGHEDAAKMDGMLPENDGMKSLRMKLHEIRNLALSTEEKALRMHGLMTEAYMAHKTGIPSPMSFSDGDRKSLSDEPLALDVGLAAMPIDPSNPYNIRPGDLEPSFSPLIVPQRQDHDMSESGELETHPVLGCMHYLRNVKIQCFDCHRWFPCRHCHDQSHDLPFPHTLRRKLTRNMLCMLCQTPQPAAEACANCQEWAAHYFCSKCKLWDNDPRKSIYHCDDCGICRLGEGLGKDFVHCKKCNVCISISTSAAHPCVEGATEGDCPLCLEEMFASREKVVSLPCGHYMHAQCYTDLMAVTYKCPVCSKSAINMELQWRKLDDEIRLQPMPVEDEDEELHEILPHVGGHVDEGEVDEQVLRRQSQQRRPKVVWIGCNDCGSRCWTEFHWLGLKCRVCDSYNTNQMAPLAGYETDTERLIRQQHIHRQHDFTGNEVLRDAGVGVEEACRVDSAFGAPSSPSLLAVPASPGSPSSIASSPGRYFVQPDEPRRPSFTVPRFSTPTLPTLSNLPEMPRLPRMPNIPQLPHIPTPTMPNLPHMPNLPNMPQLPNMPELGLPRFSPYDMFDSLSRSLSPMRYYLQGQEDEQLRRDANRSPTSVHSDPTTNATSSKRKPRIGLTDRDEVESWTSEGQSHSSEDDSDEVRNVVGDDEEEEEEDDDESETDSEGFSDAEMVEEDDLDLDLPGHR